MTNYLQPPKQALKPITLWWLLFCQVSSLAMLAAELTPWMLAIIGLCLCWRALMNVQQSAKPSKGVLVLFALAGCVLLVITGRQLGLLNSMVHLFCFAYALKSLELKVQKDIYQLSLLGIFVLASALLFVQSIYFSLLIISLLIANLLLLNSVHLSQHHSTKVFLQVKVVAVLVLQSLPLALVLFVVFPKLPPLWQVPLAKSSVTGLSDDVTIGDVANLALSDELAFRVEFQQQSPAYHMLYWRTIVLENFDGKSWRRVEHANERGDIYMRNTENDKTNKTDQWFRYQVYAEPSYQHFLSALDVASVNEPDIVQLPQYSLYAKSPVTQVKAYQVSSNASMALDLLLPSKTKQLNLTFPAAANPKLTAEGQRLRTHYQNDEAIINAVLKHFREQDYFYTLKPPPLVNNSLDQFYFQTRSGFCEYYASSFTYLMRAAGMPARVVVGYMGGEYNPNLGYYSIYQRDAHAWAEVWLANKGWVRIDPTAAVNPERVESGFSEQLLAEQADASERFFNARLYKSMTWLNTIRQQFEALDYQWTRWVVGYSAEKQLGLLTKWFGDIKPWKTMALLGLAFISTMLMLWVIFWYRTKGNKIPNTRYQRIYLHTLETFKKVSIARAKSTSPNMFLKQIKNQFHQSHPELVSCFERITAIFISLEYKTANAEINLDSELNNASNARKQIKSLEREFKRFKQLSRAL